MPRAGRDGLDMIVKIAQMAALPPGRVERQNVGLVVAQAHTSARAVKQLLQSHAALGCCQQFAALGVLGRPTCRRTGLSRVTAGSVSTGNQCLLIW